MSSILVVLLLIIVCALCIRNYINKRKEIKEYYEEANELLNTNEELDEEALERLQELKAKIREKELGRSNVRGSRLRKYYDED